MAKIRIENVVASTSLGKELDLPGISKSLEGAEYEPEQFPGLVYRMKNPKAATLLFRSGKVVCTGAKSLEEGAPCHRPPYQEDRGDRRSCDEEAGDNRPEHSRLG